MHTHPPILRLTPPDEATSHDAHAPHPHPSPAPPANPTPDLQHQGLSTQDSPLPPLSPPDATLLDHFITARESLHTLADQTGTPLRTLTAWADSPSVAPWIARFRAERTLHRQGLCLAYLESIVTATADPIEGRRAAASLLKHTAPHARRATESAGFAAYSVPSNQRRTSRAAEPAPHQDDDPAQPATASSFSSAASSSASTTRRPTPAKPPPPPTRAELFAPTPGHIITPLTQPIPDPAHTPESISETIIAALTMPDAPTTGAGAIALHNFHHDSALQRLLDAPTRTLAHFRHRVPDAFNIRTLEPGPLLPHHSQDWSARDCAITTTDDQRLLLRLTLHQPSQGPFANCWMLSDLSIRAPHIPHNPYLPPTTKDWPPSQRPRAP